MFVIPAGAPTAPPGPFGDVAPEGRDPLESSSKLFKDLDPCELRTPNMPPLPKEKRLRADLIAVPMVPTEDSVAAEMEAARVLDFL